MEQEKTSAISRVSGLSFSAQINSNRIVALFFLYIYGIYGFSKVTPTWENLDGKVFYIGSQTAIHLSIALVFFYQIKFLSDKIENKVNIVLSKFQIASFLIFIIFYISLNYSALKLDLYGDETSYAKYAYLHLEKISNLALMGNESLEDFKLRALIQIVGIIVLIVSLIAIFYLMKLPIRIFYYSLILLTICFRLINLEFFKFEDENSQPFLIIYQIFISIFGLNSFSFRLGSIFIFAIFSAVLLNEINKLLKNTIASLIVSIGFLSTPIILTMSTKIDHGMFTFFTCCFVLLWWIGGWEKSIFDRKIFVLSSIYLSLTNLIIILILVVTLALNNYRTKKIRFKQIKLSQLGILVYVLPFLTIHFFRVVKSMHITNQMNSDEIPSFMERIALTWSGIYTFADKHVLIIILIGVMSFMLIKHGGFNFIFVFLIFLAFASLTAPGALGWNRYYLEWLVPFALFLYVKIFRIKKIIPVLMSIFLILVSMINVNLFINFSKNFANFDNFVVQEKWNIASSNIQPTNIIWPGTYYEEILEESKLISKKSECLIVGNFWSAVPETLSGYSVKAIRDIQPNYDFNRKTLDELMFYKANVKEIDLSSIDCVYIVAAVNKFQLHNYLTNRGWSSTQAQIKNSDYSFFILQKPNPVG